MFEKKKKEETILLSQTYKKDRHFFTAGFLKECSLDQLLTRIILFWLFIDLYDRGVFLSIA